MPSGRAFIGTRLRRALLAGVGVAAISLATAPAAVADTTIDTTLSWNGSTIISGFGYGQPCCTATYGQTVTVPATGTWLDSFTFYVQLPTNLLFRGEVYAWDPTTGNPADFTSGNATGPALYESSAMHTTSYSGGFGPFEAITFNTGGIHLTAGAQYVLFFTISKDYAANAPTAGVAGFVGYIPTDAYSGGDFVFINNGGDASQWTTVPWTHYAPFGIPIDDLAFKASFSSSAPAPSCPPGTKANFRWHYTANGNAGGWSGTATEACPGSVSMGPQAMDGTLQVAPGATLKVGYDFTLPGNHNTLTMTVSAAQVTFAVSCVSGATTPSQPTLMVTMPAQSYSITNDQWYPSGDQSSMAVYQGSIPVPDLCGGGMISLARGGTFTATLG
jgi:hypothetical protein